MKGAFGVLVVWVGLLRGGCWFFQLGHGINAQWNINSRSSCCGLKIDRIL